MVELTRGLGDAKDVRRRTVAGLQRLAGADVVVFSELDGAGRLHVTASTDPAMVAAVEDAPASWRTVLERGEQQFAARTDHDAAPFRSVLHQPVRRGATPVALVTLGWSDRRARPPTSARQAVELVAAEAAVAVERRGPRRTGHPPRPPRRADRAREPPQLGRAPGDGDEPRRPDRLVPVRGHPRPRPLQAVQRRARSSRRRPAAEGGRGRVEQPAPPDRPAGPLGRRGVRARAARDRPGRRGAGDRPAPRPTRRWTRRSRRA